MKRFKPWSFTVRMIVLALFIAPFCLNQIWYVGGGDWLYWFSRYLCSSEMVMAGFLMVFFSRQFRDWVNRNPLTGASVGNRTWTELRHAGMQFFGVVLLIIGIIYHDKAVSSKCVPIPYVSEPLLSLFWLSFEDSKKLVLGCVFGTGRVPWKAEAGDETNPSHRGVLNSQQIP
jgi:hypothetical protein